MANRGGLFGALRALMGGGQAAPASSPKRAPPSKRELAERDARHEPYRAAAEAAARNAGVPLTIAAPGNYNRPVVGEQHYQAQLERVAGGYRREEASIIRPARLVHQDDNPHDANAVMVTIDGECVGYLLAKDALKFRAALAKLGHAGATVGVAAKIRGGLRRSPKAKVEEDFRVRLDFTWPLTLA